MSTILDTVFGRTDHSFLNRPVPLEAHGPNQTRPAAPLAWDTLDLGPYITLADETLGLVSVFDDLTYDRADADIMSVGMRRHAVKTLTEIGFKQTSGSILENLEADCRCIIPKIHALGASSFDVTRYTKKRQQDFYLLTPTQTACQIIDNHTTDDAVTRIEALIQTQPINLLRLVDYLEGKPAHKAFSKAASHLIKVQQLAIKQDPLCRRRPLG